MITFVEIGVQTGALRSVLTSTTMASPSAPPNEKPNCPGGAQEAPVPESNVTVTCGACEMTFGTMA